MNLEQMTFWELVEVQNKAGIVLVIKYWYIFLAFIAIVALVRWLIHKGVIK